MLRTEDIESDFAVCWEQRMKKMSMKCYLLSAIFLLTVVFILETLSIKVKAAEVLPEITSSELKQREDGELLLKLNIKDFVPEEKIKLRLYLKKHGIHERFREVYRKSLKAKENLSLKIPLKEEGSDIYTWRVIVLKEGKKARWEGKEPIYLKGKLAADGLIMFLPRFIDDIATVTWEGNEGSSYWVGVYEEKGLSLVDEKETTDKTVTFNLPKDSKSYMVGVALLQNGMKSHFSLKPFPDRELPNTLVTFPDTEKLDKSQYDIDLIYTGTCFATIEVNDTAFYKSVEEQGRFTVKLPEGDSSIKVTVVSDNGNVKTFQKDVFIDTIFPKINLDTELNGAVTGDSQIVVNGSCNEEVLLNLNGKKIDMDDDNHFSSILELREGENEIKIEATDKGGNVTNLRAVVKREVKHEADIRIVILVVGTFGAIFLAYFITFIGWLRARKKRKS